MAARRSTAFIHHQRLIPKRVEHTALEDFLSEAACAMPTEDLEEALRIRILVILEEFSREHQETAVEGKIEKIMALTEIAENFVTERQKTARKRDFQKMEKMMIATAATWISSWRTSQLWRTPQHASPPTTHGPADVPRRAQRLPMSASLRAKRRGELADARGCLCA